MANILAVDDDHTVREMIKLVLSEDGHHVQTADSGPTALDMIRKNLPDLVILDIIMPEMDGIEVCRQIRADPFLTKLPVIFLTSKNRPSDIASGLDAGGDDFVSKASVRVELPARIRATLRRIPGGVLDPENDVLEVGDLKLHTTRHEVTILDQVVHLTPVEHRLLHYLMMHPTQPITTDRLLEDVWEYHPGTGDPKVVRVSIARLRAKLEPEPENPHYLMNIRGRGYLIHE